MRIKCHRPSCSQTASAPYLSIPKVTPILRRLHLYQSCASATSHWQRYQCVPKPWAGSSNFASFWEPPFNKRLSQADFIFIIFSTEILFDYVKHIELRCLYTSYRSSLTIYILDNKSSHRTPQDSEWHPIVLSDLSCKWPTRNHCHLPPLTVFPHDVQLVPNALLCQWN